MKKEVRIIAWDDAAFGSSNRSVLLIGAVFRGASFIDGLLSVFVEKDGLDATEKICDAVKHSRHFDQLSYVMLDGITFAGFNMADIAGLNEATRLPVLAVMRDMPDVEKFMQAMEKLGDFGKRKEIVRRAGEIRAFRKIFYQCAGMVAAEAEELLSLTCVRSDVPEPLRVAHLIAGGLSRQTRGRSSNAGLGDTASSFESRGRA